MQKKEMKKIIISLVAVTMLVFTVLTSFATDVISDANSLRQNGNATTQNGNSVSENILDKTKNNTTAALNTTNKTANNVEKNNTANNVVNNTQGLPYTGVEYSGIIALAVCVIVAVYSYIKVKKYNV